jgi:putative salt-induced outer membrane protein YdiY
MKPQRQFHKINCLTLAVFSAISGYALAQTQPETNTNRWETTAALGVTLTSGNSDTLLMTLSLDTKHKWNQNEVAFGLSGGYGESEDVKNTEFINGFGQYNRLFTERFYAGLRLDASYDGIADLDYRVRISPLLGYYLIKNPKTTLSLEAGPSVVFEKYGPQDADTYMGVRFGERFEHKLTETTKVWQSIDYVPQVDQWLDKYLITAEVGIDTAITKRWSLRAVFQDIYDSLPASGREHNDIRLIAGTAYKF